jgi:hypothetical protein
MRAGALWACCHSTCTAPACQGKHPPICLVMGSPAKDRQCVGPSIYKTTADTLAAWRWATLSQPVYVQSGDYRAGIDAHAYCSLNNRQRPMRTHERSPVLKQMYE